jgi:hypothetical protein
MARLNENDRFWLEHVAGWQSSGQKRRDYCQMHELSERVFDRWVLRARQLSGRQRRMLTAPPPVEDQLPAFFPVVVTEDKIAEASVDAPRVGGGVIEIAYGGATIRVGADVDGRALRCVLAAVRETA